MSTLSGNPFVSVPLDNSNASVNAGSGFGDVVGSTITFENQSGDRQRIYFPARFEATNYQFWFQIYRGGQWQTYAVFNSGIPAGF